MEKTLQKPKKDGKAVSYITRGAVVLAESEAEYRGFRLLYRLSVEPRPRLRSEDKYITSYTVTIEKLYSDKRSHASLRDFTSEKAVAEEFYRLVSKKLLFPEHLEDFYEDYMS